jgi:hypothetical protein
MLLELAHQSSTTPLLVLRWAVGMRVGMPQNVALHLNMQKSSSSFFVHLDPQKHG